MDNTSSTKAQSSKMMKLWQPSDIVTLKIHNPTIDYEDESQIIEDRDGELIRDPSKLLAQIRDYEIEEEDTTEETRIRKSKTSKMITDMQGEFLAKALKPHAEYIRVNGHRPPFINTDEILRYHLNDFYDLNENNQRQLLNPIIVEESSTLLKRPSILLRDVLTLNKKKKPHAKTSMSPTQEEGQDEKESQLLEYESPSPSPLLRQIEDVEEDHYQLDEDDDEDETMVEDNQQEYFDKSTDKRKKKAFKNTAPCMEDLGDDEFFDEDSWIDAIEEMETSLELLHLLLESEENPPNYS